jgi:hypothetical protein
MGFIAPLTSLITLILGVSLAVERVIEILKGLIPPLAKAQPNIDWEYVRCAAMHLLAAGTGTLVAWAGQIDLFQKLTGSPSHDLVAGYIVCGLLTAGGSAFWNHVLDILQAAKINSESNAANAAKVAGNTNRIPG